MGIKSFLSRLSLSPKGRVLDREGLERTGITLLSDEKLAQRLEDMRKFMQAMDDAFTVEPDAKLTPLKAIDQWVGSMKLLDAAIDTLSVPYGRAGTYEHYRRATIAWARLYAKGMDVIEVARQVIEDNEKAGATRKWNQLEQWENIRLLEGFLRIEMLPYAKMIMNYSYFREDVTPAHATIIQSVISPNAVTPPPTRLSSFDFEALRKKDAQRREATA